MKPASKHRVGKVGKRETRGNQRISKRPNFLARLKRIYGNKVVKGDVVVEERQSRDI